MRRSLLRSVAGAALRAPAVLVLDAIDALVPAVGEDHGDSAAAHALAEMVRDVVRTAQTVQRIGLVAVARSREAVHPILLDAWTFDAVVPLERPTAEVRSRIARALLARMVPPVAAAADVDWATVTDASTEGFGARDLELLLLRAVHTASLRQMAAPPGTALELCASDFEAAKRGFVAAGLASTALHESTNEWDDVGGLLAVKEALLETMLWPSQYPELFAACPLRLRSGVLLYGPPGCGKTHIAGAVAARCNLRFVSVAGPELLNKYIGASEQAVRDVFERASAARPCVLFFDEFDSIAPRRGHDSTGVTDRVVNQFLTQLDGVEGLEGVYVVAATGRPDLIDPALLRPGRLDKMLFCGMPDAAERASILEALSRKMALAPDVDLEAVAAACPGLSGADLKGILGNAQLRAAHEVLAAPAPESDGQEPAGSPAAEAVAERLGLRGATRAAGDVATEVQGMAITQAHLLVCAAEARPSVGRSQLAQLDRIYDAFSGGDGRVAATGSRATLA